MTRRPVRFRLTAPEPPERPIHRDTLSALRTCLPGEAFVFHYPYPVCSAGAWNAVASLGAVAGFPDIGVALWGRLYTLELKAEDGRETEAQKDLAPRLAAARVYRAVVRSPQEALAALRGWGLPVRRHAFLERSNLPPLILPDGFERLREPWARASQASAMALRSMLAAGPPEPWLLGELIANENRLRDLAAPARAWQ